MDTKRRAKAKPSNYEYPLVITNGSTARVAGAGLLLLLFWVNLDDHTSHVGITHFTAHILVQILQYNLI